MHRKTQKLSRPVGRYYSDVWYQQSRIEVITDFALKFIAIIAATVIIVAGIRTFGINKTFRNHQDLSSGCGQRTPVTGREVVIDPPVYRLNGTDPEKENQSGIVNDQNGVEGQENGAAPGLQQTQYHLWDLKAIGENDFWTLFMPATRVNDYKGDDVIDSNRAEGNERPVFTVKGDGIMDCYRYGVTFINSGDYAFIEGHICLSDDNRTLEAVETGFITLVILDSSGREVSRGPQLCSALRESDFLLRIKGMDEFTIAVDCTDGRADGDYMTMIVEDLKLTR